MITPSQSLSSIAIAQRQKKGPYAGPERRVADRRGANEARLRTGGFHALGPYLSDGGRSSQRPATTADQGCGSAAVAPSPFSAALAFGVLKEHLIEDDAVLAEHTLHEVVPHEVGHHGFGLRDVAPTDAVDAEMLSARPRAGIELPWITAFLDDVSDAVVPAAQGAVVSSSDSATIEAELWPLDDAGARMRELASALESHTRSDHTPIVHEAAAREPNAATVAPLEMWHDDDFVDVMPVHLPSLPTYPAATPPSAMRDNAPAHESAALALEALARRVRRGEVDFPPFHGELGDAAALATALVMLLGPRV